MVVFLDTSAIYAAAARSDISHAAGVEALAAATRAGDSILTHNYVVLESAALLARRLGKTAAAEFLRHLSGFQIRWVDEALHNAAVAKYQERGGRISLVDEVSFLVMKEAGARHALAFDEDFQREGFLPFPTAPQS